MESIKRTIDIQKNVFTIHPIAIPAAENWQSLKRHWTNKQFSSLDIKNLINTSLVHTVKTKTGYHYFSHFEIVRLAHMHQVSKINILLHPSIKDDEIRLYSLDYFSYIKIYNLDRKKGLGSIKEASCRFIDQEICKEYFGDPLTFTKSAAEHLRISHKTLRGQISKLKGRKHV